MAELSHGLVSDERPAQSAAAGRGAEGEGELAVQFDGRSSVVLRIEARYPLKLLHHINRHSQQLPADTVKLPRLPSHVPPVVQMVGYGGGLLGADRLSLNVRLAEHSSLLLTTPANGRAYKQQQPAYTTTARSSSSRPSHFSSELRHTFHLGPSSLLLFVPSPLSLFARSSLATATTAHLHPTASLLLLDVIAGGRHTQGEQFGQSDYSATTTLHFDGDGRVPALRDRTVLRGRQCEDEAAFGRYKARGTVLLLGPHLLPLAVQLFLAHNQRTVRKRARSAESAAVSTECVVSAAWVCGHAPELLPADYLVDSAAVERCLSGGRVSGGCLLRLLSVEVESLLHTVGQLLAPVDSHMQGVAPWQRV